MSVGAIPEWLATALLAAALATLGFVGKQIVEWIASVNTARRVRRTRLVSLLSLLNGSAAVYRVQAELRDRLVAAVMKRNAEPTKGRPGFNAVFSSSFSQLGALEAHLLMWIAKYSAWIPDTPAHALVYLADEEAHGVPFPSGIERTIEQALGVAGDAG